MSWNYQLTFQFTKVPVTINKISSFYFGIKRAKTVLRCINYIFLLVYSYLGDNNYCPLTCLYMNIRRSEKYYKTLPKIGTGQSTIVWTVLNFKTYFYYYFFNFLQRTLYSYFNDSLVDTRWPRPNASSQIL